MKENRIEEQKRALEKYLNGEQLDYYETIIVFAVVSSISLCLIKKVAELSLEREVES